VVETMCSVFILDRERTVFRSQLTLNGIYIRHSVSYLRHNVSESGFCLQAGERD
jgi:hypothetical protein